MPAPWTESHVRRLFWRAGFGATPAEAERWAAAGRAATLRWVVEGAGRAALVGPPPLVEGKAIDPVNEWGHDVLWWLDRMVRTTRPLEEKLTLFWHDHFATAGQETPLMLAQNRTLRKYALGRFRPLLGAVTRDPAMQLFLSLAGSSKDAPNENYARELMELFTLGGRGYRERDIREAARALTGYEARWNGGFRGIRYRRDRHDGGRKVIFGRRGRFGVDDVLDLVCAHRAHAPFLVGKLWSFFVTEPADRATLASLVRTYRRSRGAIKPVVAAILGHPALYRDLDAPDMVKSPIVFMAGALRTTSTPVNEFAWVWLMDSMGQTLFDPPSVAGWSWGPAWLSSNAMRARFITANYLIGRDGPLGVPDGSAEASLTPEAHLERAEAATGRPFASADTRAALLDVARRTNADLRRGQAQERADHTQRALRHLLLTSPDAQLH